MSTYTQAPASEATNTGGAAALDVRQLTPRIGAEIRGADLAEELDAAQFEVVRDALLAHHVVFFRNQRLDGEAQIALARKFGPLTLAHPTSHPVFGVPSLLDLDSETGGHADQWHTDVTFIAQPPDVSVLRAVVIPEVGGDTLWASTVAGYEALRPELRQLAEQLRAVHTNNYDYARADVGRLEGAAESARAAFYRQFVSTVFETEHPLVRVHPETGERALLLGSFAQRIVGYTTSESADLIRLFQTYVTRPDNTVRWQWEEGDVAIWDNRATQHYATYNYGAAHRQVQRVTTIGTVPIGVDGRASQAIKGDASLYNTATAAA